MGKIKYLLIMLIGALIIVLLVKFNTYTRYYYKNNNQIINEFNTLKDNLLDLKYKVLVLSVYMYKNNDIIIDSIKNLQKSQEEIVKDVFLKENFPNTYQKLSEIHMILNKKISYIYDFQMVNSAIKNSIMYLSNLLYKLQDILHKNNITNIPDYEKHVAKTISSIFLAKSSFDADFIKNLDIDYFKRFKTNNKDLKSYNEILLSNLILFNKYFILYEKNINLISDNKDLNMLNEIYKNYFMKMNKKLVIIKFVSWILIVFVLVSGIVVLLLMYKIEQENTKLQLLYKQIKISSITDKLTGLYNRIKFDNDIKKFKKPIVLLVNIDKFKHFNDYFGMEIGDKILTKTAKIIRKITKTEIPSADYYRLGADDFGIVWEYDKYQDYEKISKKIISYFEKHEITIDELNLQISVSIGISMDEPYLENADIALKNVKKDIRKKYLIYNKEMNEKTQIGKNIELAKILYQAIKDNRIIPYFQPIIDSKTLKIAKYEVLARILHNNGEVQSIYPYLQIAKDNKLYSEITKIIYTKAYEIFKNNNEKFSLNLSIDDIYDEEIVDLINKLFVNSSLSKRLTFELLESEAIQDYKIVENFITQTKKNGITFAIDDFGSGYSNFAHILNLNIDFIKIDGSLIKNIDKDENSKKIVKVISTFAKETNIAIVAEYVENENISNILKELGVEYFQGFYFYKPSANFVV